MKKLKLFGNLSDYDSGEGDDSELTFLRILKTVMNMTELLVTARVT